MRKYSVLALLGLEIFLSYTVASCGAFIKAAEEKYSIPPGLLKAIITLESKATPWAVNTSHSSRFFKDKATALTYISTLKNNGTSNINVGCAQLNIRSHGHHFKGGLGHILDPDCNIHYAARFLRTLYNKTGSWEKAVRQYNSPSNGAHYQKQVFKIWHRNQLKENLAKQNSARLIPIRATIKTK